MEKKNFDFEYEAEEAPDKKEEDTTAPEPESNTADNPTAEQLEHPKEPDLLPEKDTSSSEEKAPPKETGKVEAEEIHKKKDGRFLKLASGFFGLLFCTVTLVFTLSFVISAADKYILSAGKQFMLLEVTGGAVSLVTPETEAEENPPLSGEANEEKPEESAESYPVTSYDLSAGSQPFTLSNQTAFSPDTTSLLRVGNENKTPAEIYEKYGSDAPVVLIVHTHGTESYSSGKDTYTKEDSFRTDDTSKNVVAVGALMTEVFESAGINTLHCTEMFDKESYKDSYSRAYAAVSEYLKKYPSITYIFDVHRDSIIKDDLTKIRLIGAYENEDVAQAMIVVGTDEGGADHKNWEKNLAFALDAQKKLHTLSPSTPRKINLRSAAFNQGLSNGSLLLEIGSCGNTLEEAKRCAVLTSFALSDTILKKPSNLKYSDFSSFITPQ